MYMKLVAHEAEAYPDLSGFLSVKRLEVFLLPLDGMLVHRSVFPSSKLAGSISTPPWMGC